MKEQEPKVEGCESMVVILPHHYADMSGTGKLPSHARIVPFCRHKTICCCETSCQEVDLHGPIRRI